MSIIVFDCETTGLLAPIAAGVEHQPHLIDFYGIKLNSDLEAIEGFNFRCNPGISIPSEATKVHGISDADVVSCKPFARWFPLLAEFFTGSRVLVGHNLLYDKSVLYWELVRMGKALSFPWGIRGIDTAESIQQYLGHRVNLTDLHTYLFGSGFSGAHSADADCTITTMCFREMVKKGMIVL